MTDDLLKENATLRAEIERLKGEVATLKKSADEVVSLAEQLSRAPLKGISWWEGFEEAQRKYRQITRSTRPRRRWRGSMSAATVYLLVIVITGGGGVYRDYHPMPSWEECHKAAQSAQLDFCNAGDCEASVAVTCVGGKPE